MVKGGVGTEMEFKEQGGGREAGMGAVIIALFFLYGGGGVLSVLKLS